MQNLQCARIAIIGLGYVGPTLAVEFGKRYDMLGFDTNAACVDSLRTDCDPIIEIDGSKMAAHDPLAHAMEAQHEL